MSVRSTRITTTPIAFMLAHSASVEDQLMQIASEQEEIIIAIVSVGADFTFASDQVVSWKPFLDVAYHFRTCNSVPSGDNKK